MRHGSEGWKCLETSFRALQHVMEGCGAAFSPYLTPEVRALVYRGLLHPNRFVREACHFMLGTFCRLVTSDELAALGPEVAHKLGLGLSDNWSQVRYAASVATRTFLTASASNWTPSSLCWCPTCASTDTTSLRGFGSTPKRRGGWWWGGRPGVGGAVRPPSGVILHRAEQGQQSRGAGGGVCLHRRADGESGPGRGGASRPPPPSRPCYLLQGRVLAGTGRGLYRLWALLIAFPAKSREVLEELYSLWFAHLADNIYSVRQDSAVALGDAARAYGEEAVSRIVTQLQTVLPPPRTSPPTPPRGEAWRTPPSLVSQRSGGSVRNDPASHTDQTMFSCGSLAPKLQRGGGCVDHGFSQAKSRGRRATAGSTCCTSWQP